MRAPRPKTADAKPVLMKTPVEWETWCDAFWTEHKRYPWWHELVGAIQEDAIASDRLRARRAG